MTVSLTMAFTPSARSARTPGATQPTAVPSKINKYLFINVTWILTTTRRASSTTPNFRHLRSSQYSNPASTAESIRAKTMAHFKYFACLRRAAVLPMPGSR